MSWSQAFREEAMVNGQSFFDTDSHLFFHWKNCSSALMGIGRSSWYCSIISFTIISLSTMTEGMTHTLSKLCYHIYQICYQFLVWDGLSKDSKHFSRILKWCIWFSIGTKNLSGNNSWHSWLNVNWYCYCTRLTITSFEQTGFCILSFLLQIVSNKLHLMKQYKESPRGVTMEKWSESMHQIYRRTTTLKCDFNIVAYFQKKIISFKGFLLYKNISR